MEQFLTYELAPQTPSLFLDGAIRKPTNKAVGRLVYTVPPCVQTVVVKHATM